MKTNGISTRIKVEEMNNDPYANDRTLIPPILKKST